MFKVNGLSGVDAVLLVELEFKPELVRLSLNHPSEELNVDLLLNNLNAPKPNVLLTVL